MRMFVFLNLAPNSPKYALLVFPMMYSIVLSANSMRRYSGILCFFETLTLQLSRRREQSQQRANLRVNRGFNIFNTSEVPQVLCTQDFMRILNIPSIVNIVVGFG